MNPLAAHMQRVYQVYYFPWDYRAYLVTRQEPYVDVRHILRTRLGSLHEAGPTAVAEAEASLAGKPVSHSAIIHSRTFTAEVLMVYQPLLVKRVERLIKVTE